MGVCVCTIVNTLLGAECETLWAESHYDAVETVKFMGWILLKADGVIKSSAAHQTPGWAPFNMAEPPTLAGKKHAHRQTQKSRDEARNSASDHSTALLDSY